MAMPSEQAVVAKLKSLQEYVDGFAKAFPDNKDPVTYDNLAKAIAAFERTLKTSDRFDDFLKGDLKALSDEEKKGLDTFIKTGCTACHSGPLLGAQMFQKLGLVNAYENTADEGRFAVTQNPTDKFVFKVPSLRNIALTAPYFHDGSQATLPDAIKKMAWLQLGKTLEDKDVQAINTFLLSLSDKNRI